MRRLEDIKVGYRIALTLAIVVILLLVMAAYGYFSGAWDQAEGQTTLRQDNVDIYAGIPPDAQLIQLDRLALREAYHQQVIGLWTIWLKGQAGDPTYFKNGLLIARRAYAQALTQISRRESEIMEKESQRQ